jgi:hypothetical protein
MSATGIDEAKLDPLMRQAVTDIGATETPFTPILEARP